MNDCITTSGRPAVALSGGADSLYSLLVLLEAGEEPMAAHALFLPKELRPDWYSCLFQGLESVCSRLGVDLHVCDLSREFERRVIRPFVQGYLAGLTPNPCALCNQAMKFGLLAEHMLSLGASTLVTGHYAEILQTPDGPALYAGADPRKDQSYFLSLTPQRQYARVRLPLGRESKSAVLAALSTRGLQPPHKGESQEICFIPANDYRAFLRAYAEKHNIVLPCPGPMTLPDGKVVGEHRGLWAYTQGQRHGLGVAWSEPLYVLDKDPERNVLILGVQADFKRASCLCRDLNFLVQPGEWPTELLAKTRYRQPLEAVRAELESGPSGLLMRLTFPPESAQPPPAPGQIAAIYARDSHGLRLLAGGVIG